MTIKARDVRRLLLWDRLWGPFHFAGLNLPQYHDTPRQAVQVTVFLPFGQRLLLQWSWRL